MLITVAIAFSGNLIPLGIKTATNGKSLMSKLNYLRLTVAYREIIIYSYDHFLADLIYTKREKRPAGSTSKFQGKGAPEAAQ